MSSLYIYEDIKLENKDVKEIEFHIVLAPDNEEVITLKELDEALETTILQDTFSDKTKTEKDKQAVAQSQLSKYIKQKYGDEVQSEVDLIQGFRALRKLYNTSYHDVVIKTPWETYTFSMLGTDIKLLKSTRTTIILTILVIIAFEIQGVRFEELTNRTGAVCYLMLFILCLKLVQLVTAMINDISSNF